MPRIWFFQQSTFTGAGSERQGVGKGCQDRRQRFLGSSLSNILCDFKVFSYLVHCVSSESSWHLLTVMHRKLPVLDCMEAVTILLGSKLRCSHHKGCQKASDVSSTLSAAFCCYPAQLCTKLARTVSASHCTYYNSAINWSLLISFTASLNCKQFCKAMGK